MSHDVWLDSLRGAVRDPVALDRVLAGNLPTDALQQIGDAVLATFELPGAVLTGATERLTHIAQLDRQRLPLRHATADDILEGRPSTPPTQVVTSPV